MPQRDGIEPKREKKHTKKKKSLLKRKSGERRRRYKRKNWKQPGQRSEEGISTLEQQHHPFLGRWEGSSGRSQWSLEGEEDEEDETHPGEGDHLLVQKGQGSKEERHIGRSSLFWQDVPQPLVDGKGQRKEERKKRKKRMRMRKRRMGKEKKKGLRGGRCVGREK